MHEKQPSADTPRDNARHGIFWVGFILLLLGGQVLLMLVMVYLATSDRSFAIEPDYYQKGLQWDDVMAQRRENERLGWAMRVRLADHVTVLDQRKVICEVTDDAGSPVEGAVVDLVAFPHARGNDRAYATLTDTGNGFYETDLRMLRGGLWEFRLVVQHTEGTFSHTELCKVQPPGEA
jgi:nitrogen fixation protein FixH